MQIRYSRSLPVALSILFACSVPGVAQDLSDPQGVSDTSTRSKESKKREKKIAKELGPAYGTWLRDEVPYIISDDERRAFLELSTNEEREQYIELFWNNRNPHPESPENSFREEHYRRLAYADEHFASGIAGRKTDRGRIYIIWGPADEIESHPTGGTYDRPAAQGSGSTTTYPWELWRYRHLEGIGENIEIEFVDPSGSGEYHMTSDPCEKDALARIPGAGLGLSEMIGQSSKSARFTNSSGTSCPAPIGGNAAGANEFDTLDRYFRVQHPPQHFKDLAEIVSSRQVANQLPFQYRTDFLRATTTTALVPITIQLRNQDIGYRGKEGVQSAVLDIYGRVSDPGGRTIQTFEDIVSKDIPQSLFEASRDMNSIYQKSVPLRSGLYRLDLVVKDTETGNVGVIGAVLRVPRFEQERLDASSLILADQIEPAFTRQADGGQFLLDAYKVRPRIGQELASTEKLGIYFQLYNLKLDEESRKPRVSIAYRILKDRQEVWQSVETPEAVHQSGEQLSIQRFVPVASLLPGRYTIEVTAIDQLTNETIIRTSEFTIKTPAVKVNAPKPKL